ALVQIAALCLKSGNAVLLKGGREAIESNRALATVMHDAAVAAGAPEGWLVLLETREDVSAILGLDRDIDLIIPRGSNEFVRYIMENTNIAVMGHADGICHVFVETEADADKSVRICVDAKTQYVSVCNAAETILIDRAALAEIGPKLLRALDDAGVEIRGDVEIQALAGGIAITPAVEDDWRAEYLDYVVAIRVVAGMAEAVDHINEYGSHHTDAIVTENAAQAAAFIAAVDSSSVVHNASTRFADGFRYGLGAEVGISTNRLHSRGPVGLEGLCSYKYVLLGDGHTVDDFESGVRSFTHRPLDRTYSPGS
ncbi:MAG TPA: glutamate-5-semialdehyde dehydrogenase, partial [Lentisphaeria bacterium]|nr:glutamate-5-semialdehyde dehydrogenase [Lentisphaeria bacterium]